MADPAWLSGCFTGGARGRLETGATVTRDFAVSPGAFPVEAVEVVPDRRVALRGQADDAPPEAGAASMLTQAGEQTIHPARRRASLVTIREKGWRQTEGGLGGLIRQLSGLVADARRHEGLPRAWHNLRDGMSA